MSFDFFSCSKNENIAVPKLYMGIRSSTGSKVYIEDYCEGEENNFVLKILNNSKKAFLRHYSVSVEKKNVIDNFFGTRGDKSAYVVSLNCNEEDLLKAIEKKEFHTCIIKAENYKDIRKNELKDKNAKSYPIETFWGSNYQKKEDPIGCRCF